MVGNKFFRCCGPWASHFHLSCPHFSESVYERHTDAGVSTYKNAICVKTLLSQRNDDTLVKSCSLLLYYFCYDKASYELKKLKNCNSHYLINYSLMMYLETLIHIQGR
jgi:hypothetical protein